MKAKILANGVCNGGFGENLMFNTTFLKWKDVSFGKLDFVFDLSDGRSLEIKVAISAVDKRRSPGSIWKKETQGKNFDKVLA